MVREPKQFKLYDAPHALNAEARRDRIAFLAEQVSLSQPPSRVEIAAIPDLPQLPPSPQEGRNVSNTSDSTSGIQPLIPALPESEILQEEIAARTKEYGNWNRQKLHQAPHARSCTRRQSRLDNGLIVMIQQQIAILASDKLSRWP